MKAPGAGAAPAVELDGSDDVVRTYTWGLDLAGLHTANGGPGRSGYPTSGGFLQAAGGIGGLLAVYDADASDGYVYFHDANGNVGQVVAWENGYGGANGDDWHADRLVAKYEYSPFGAVVGPDDDADGDWRDDAGAFATDNPFRFSTKWHDDAIGIVDFGARMYSATLGRFLNRDPIAEAGGVNLYAFSANNPVNYVDPFGYHVIPCPSPGSCGSDVGSQEPLFGGGVPLPGLGGDGTPVLAQLATGGQRCKKCSLCTDRNNNLFGYTTCENHKPCICICKDRFKEFFYPGDELEECTIKHENVHVGAVGGRTPGIPGGCEKSGEGLVDTPPKGEYEECEADLVAMECAIDKPLNVCRDVTNMTHRCKCVRDVLKYIARSTHCHSQCPKDVKDKCFTKLREVKEYLKQVRKACDKGDWPGTNEPTPPSFD